MYFFLLQVLATVVAAVLLVVNAENAAEENTLDQQLFNDLRQGTRSVVAFGHLLDDRLFLVLSGSSNNKDDSGGGGEHKTAFDDYYFYEVPSGNVQHQDRQRISSVKLVNGAKLCSRFRNFGQVVPAQTPIMFTYALNGADYLLLLFSVVGEKEVLLLKKYHIDTGIEEADSSELERLKLTSNHLPVMAVLSAGDSHTVYVLRNFPRLNSANSGQWQFTLVEYRITKSPADSEDKSVTINCATKNEQGSCIANVTLTGGYHFGMTSANGTFYLFASSVGGKGLPRVIEFTLRASSSSGNLAISTLHLEGFFSLPEPSPNPPHPQPPPPPPPPPSDEDSTLTAIVTMIISVFMVVSFFTVGCFFYFFWEFRRSKPDRPLTRGNWCQNPATVLRDRRRRSSSAGRRGERGRGRVVVSAAVALQRAVEKRRRQKGQQQQQVTKTNSNKAIQKKISVQKVEPKVAVTAAAAAADKTSDLEKRRCEIES